MLMKRSDTIKIGGKSVKVGKIVVAQWKELLDTLSIVPQLILTVISAPAEQRAGYAVVAIRESFDEIVRVTSLLTGIDEEYIEQNAAIDEIVAYYAALIKVNNFGEMLKNAPSVLGAANQALTTQSQDAT